MKRRWVGGGAALVLVVGLLSYLAWANVGKLRTHTGQGSTDAEELARLRERVDRLERTVSRLRSRADKRDGARASGASLPGVSAAAGSLRMIGGGTGTASGAGMQTVQGKLAPGGATSTSSSAAFAAGTDPAIDAQEDEGGFDDAAGAEAGQGMGKRLSRLQKKANLSDDQVSAVAEALKTERQKISALKQSGGAAGAAGGKARHEIQEVRKQTNQEIRQMLAPDQYSAYASMRRRGTGHRATSGDGAGDK